MKNSILAVLIALCAALAVATLRAAAQSVMTGPRTPPGLATVAPAGQAPASQAPAGQAPAAPAPVTPAPATPAGAIQDATVAPDKRQSADNNVSFPVDI
jgi:hypothetical protein